MKRVSLIKTFFLIGIKNFIMCLMLFHGFKIFPEYQLQFFIVMLVLLFLTASNSDLSNTKRSIDKEILDATNRLFEKLGGKL
jgi:hypothetical protein